MKRWNQKSPHQKGRQRASASNGAPRAKRPLAAHAIAVVVAALLVAGATAATFSFTSLGTADSETKTLADLAQARAQLGEGKRLLDRISEGRSSQPAAVAAVEPAQSVAAATSPPVTAAPDRLSWLQQWLPRVPAPKPAAITHSVELLPPLTRANFAALAIELSAPPAPLPTVVAPTATTTRLPLPSDQPPVAAPAQVPPPSFGALEPLPVTPDVARKSGKTREASCAAILEQAQLGDLTLEDRATLQRRCR